MEVDFLRKRDVENKIQFTDLNSPDYDPAAHGNVTFSSGMRKIRAILPDNRVVTGVEVFRQVYAAIGLGWMFEMTNVPIIGKVADAVYDLWAENRLRLTGRGDMADRLKAKAAEIRAKGEVVCDDNG
jgi:predicted DCC family thiol-disulfide oxidoreductase YuxK